MGELYEWYKKNGICPRCGCERAAPNRVCCEVCLAKNCEASMRWLSRMTATQKNELTKRKNDYKKMRYRQRKENGLCVWCARPLSKTSKCYCTECEIKNRKRNIAKKDGIERAERPSYGLCYICGEPSNGKSLCEKHLQIAKDNLPKTINDTVKMYQRNLNNQVFNN